jgi:ketosteroid isomerase-like protein
MNTMRIRSPASTIIVAGLSLLAGYALLSQEPGKPPPAAAEAGLRQAVERFIAAADKGDTAAVAGMYDPAFTNVRVADDGGVVRLTREQVLQFLGRAGANAIPTKETTIHHAEVLGDQGFVLLVRTKDLGQGWEPMFYSLVWKKQGGDWRLVREFVHQRSLPKPR